MADEKVSANKLFRELQSKGYQKPFADFADWYKNNQHIADKGINSVYDALLGEKMDSGISKEDKQQFTDATKPKTKIFGLPPVAAGVVAVVAIGCVIAGGMYLFRSKDKA